MLKQKHLGVQIKGTDSLFLQRFIRIGNYWIQKQDRFINLAENTFKAYCSRLRHFNNKIDQWLDDAFEENLDSNSIAYIMDRFDAANINNLFTQDYNNQLQKKNKNLTPDEINSHRAALKFFAEVIIGIYDANVWAFRNVEKININLCQLIAQNAIFVTPELVGNIMIGKAGATSKQQQGNRFASWDNCMTVRSKAGNRTQVNVPELASLKVLPLADDNTNANQDCEEPQIIAQKSFLTPPNIIPQSLIFNPKSLLLPVTCY